MKLSRNPSLWPSWNSRGGRVGVGNNALRRRGAGFCLINFDGRAGRETLVWEQDWIGMVRSGLREFWGVFGSS